LGQEADKLQITPRGNGGYDVTNMGTGDIVRSVEPTQDPLEQEFMRARIAATQAQVRQQNAQAARTRRPAAGRSGGARAHGFTDVPPGAVVE